MRVGFPFIIICLALPALALANSAYLPGSYEQGSKDIMVLDSASAERIITYNLGGLLGDDIEFTVRYANLDAQNGAFGDSVTGAAFRIFFQGNSAAQVSDIISGSFAGLTVGIDPLADSVSIRLALESESDPLAFYLPLIVATDTINPARIVDLQVVQNFRNGIELSWSAPGDDSLSGQASLYDMRYASFPPDMDTLVWWDSATASTDMPYPGNPGASQSVLISPLDTLTTYYFIMVSYDELGNRSGFSNLASATTGGAYLNYCLYFSGDKFAMVPFDTILNTGQQMTLEAWFYLEDDYAWNHATILDKPAPTHNAPFYQYNIGPANHTDFFAHVAVNGWYNPFEVYNVVSTDTWIHAAVTYDGMIKRLYLNGVLLANIAEAGTLDSYDTNIRIGAMGNFNDWFFKGYLDEIRLWNVARSQAEIQQNMNHMLHGNEAGLAAYWNFDEGAGQVFFDRSSNFADGYLGELPDPDNRDPIWAPSTAPVDTLVTGIGESTENRLPGKHELLQNYPNPFNGETVISFNLAEDSHIRLEIYDMLGRRIETPFEGLVEAGEHEIVWNGRTPSGGELSSGIYFCRLKSDYLDKTRRMLLLK